MSGAEGNAEAVDWGSLNPRAVRLSESVAGRLESMIVSGELAPGRKLPAERDLARLLGVSRGLVREAIHELALKGLVHRRQGRGTEVRGPYRSEFTGAIIGYLTQDARDVTELLDFREALEPPIAARAAERATSVDVQRLHRISAALDAEADPVRAADLDAQFHHAIALATRNHVLVMLVETSLEVLNQTRRRNLQTPERRRISREAHRAILAAVEAGDGEAAEGAMTDHIRGVAALVMQADGAPRFQAEKTGGDDD